MKQNMQRVEAYAFSGSEIPAIIHETLSKRELEVLYCIATGMSNQEIAQTIAITVGTVKRHTNSIYSKLNVRNRLQAVIYAQSHNMLPSLHRGS